jgi:hypothetical protein
MAPILVVGVDMIYSDMQKFLPWLTSLSSNAMSSVFRLENRIGKILFIESFLSAFSKIAYNRNLERIVLWKHF